MKLVIPTNWDDALIEKVKRPEISAVYGKLDRDFVGGGRPSSMFGSLSRRAAGGHVARLAAAGHQARSTRTVVPESSCHGPASV